MDNSKVTSIHRKPFIRLHNINLQEASNSNLCNFC